MPGSLRGSGSVVGLLQATLLATVLATLLALAGCGDDTTGTVTDSPAPGPSSSGSPDGDPGDEDDAEPTGPVDFELVEMITVTAAGGEDLSGPAYALTDEVAVQEFAAQFERDEMGQRLLAAYDGLEIPVGQALYGAVVAIGCDVPPGVTVTSADSGLVITGQKPESPTVECFAPMTTVALVLVDESVVG